MNAVRASAVHRSVSQAVVAASSTSTTAAHALHSSAGTMNSKEPHEHEAKPAEQHAPRVESGIYKKLEASFQPKFLSVINESGMHNVPKGSETHFKVIIVSDKFINESLINRHRLVNTILNVELKSGVHALSIVAKTPDQWASSDKTVVKSPPCRGGTGL